MKERAIIGTYVLALVTFGAIAVAAFIHFGRLGEQSAQVRHTHEVLTSLEEGLGALKDVETGQRGYLIAGDESFLEPYRTSSAVVNQRFARLEDLTRDNPVQQERLKALLPVVEAKVAHSAANVALFRSGRRDEARKMVASGRGKALMDDIRARVNELEEEERRLLETRTQQAETTGLRTTVLFFFGNGFAFALLATGTLLMGREFNRRRRLEQSLGFEREREVLEMAASRAQVKLRALIEELPLAIVLIDDPTGKLALHNREMAALYGGPLPSSEDGEGYRPLELLPPEDAAFPNAEDALLRAYRNGAEVRSERARLRSADGSSKSVLVTAVPLRDEEGRVLAAVAVFQDCAELEAIEEQRNRAARFREVFVSALGHDLRNPLSVITAGSSALAPRVQTAAESKVVARMASSADRMARMIDQLLDLAQTRLGSGRSYKAERLDIGATVRKVVEELEVSHPDRSLEIHSEGELAGTWDREQVENAIRNLVVNALEHGREDAPVRVASKGGEDQVVVEVHNWGNPIPEELEPLIFDPFRRAAERKRMQSVGLGLGLYLALQAVQAHGGGIELDSTAERGTMFRITLPRNHE